jgi:hypothetical protein
VASLDPIGKEGEQELADFNPCAIGINLEII